MQNIIYVLLARDLVSDPTGVRSRLDDVLVGRVPAPTSPDFAEEPPNPAAQPLPITREGKPDMDKLRETWGSTPDAAASKSALDDLVKKAGGQRGIRGVR